MLHSGNACTWSRTRVHIWQHHNAGRSTFEWLPDVAVVALRARLVVEVAGTLVSGTYRYTRIWAREHGGHWQVVGGHVSEIASA